MDQSRRLGFIDIGARGGLSGLAQQHADRIVQVLVEPDPAEAERLRAESANGARYRVIGFPLGHIDGEVTFHETVNPFCSSVLKVKHAFIDDYRNLVEHFAPKAAVPFQCRRYDTLYHQERLPLPHILKVDVQGFEYQVLQGFGGLLQHTLGIILEAHFYQLYEEQRLLHDIVAYLADFGFILRKLHNDRRPHLNGDPHFADDLVEVDAVFTKTQAWAAGQDAQTRADLNFACTLLGVTANR